MDRISWNAIQARLLVIAGLHLGFHACCHLLTQPAIAGPKCDGFYVPVVPLQREITRDAENEPDIHGHAFAHVQSRGLRPFPNSADQCVIVHSPINVKYSGHTS